MGMRDTYGSAYDNLANFHLCKSGGEGGMHKQEQRALQVCSADVQGFRQAARKLNAGKTFQALRDGAIGRQK